VSATIHVVDDDEDFRTGVARLLGTAGYEVRTYPSAGDFLLSQPAEGPGCLILDLNMPGPSGLDLQQALAHRPATLPIVFLTGRGDIESGVRAMKLGAVDFLTKPAEPETILAAVEAALMRDREARAQDAGLATVRLRHARLTAREREVFDLVVTGARNKTIARALGITERTVKMHRGQLMQKMQATSVADLVHAAELLRPR